MAKQTALWKYFTTKEPTKEEILPKPDGPLSTSMPSSALAAAANSTVREQQRAASLHLLLMMRHNLPILVECTMYLVILKEHRLAK